MSDPDRRFMDPSFERDRERDLDYDDDPVELWPAPPEVSPGKRTLTASLLPVYRDAAGDPSLAPGAAEAVARAQSSSGQPLPDALRARFERSLGVDLGGVRVHTGDAAALAARELGARAYTQGQDIFFATGKYDPFSHDGQALLAHEVVHTVQQRGAAPAPRARLEVSRPGDALEVEADALSSRLARGERAAIASAPALVSRAGRQVIARDGGDAEERRRAPPQERRLRRQFVVPREYSDLSEEIEQWLARQVMSRTEVDTPEGGRAPIRRERQLVASSNLRELHQSLLDFDVGSQVTIEARLVPGAHRYERVEFRVPGRVVLEPTQIEGDPGEAPGGERPSPPRGVMPAGDDARGDIIEGGLNRSRSPVPSVVGHTASAARVGTIVAGATAAEAVLAPIAAAISCFQMMWSVFNIFREIEGERAAGMGVVDYVWIIASRVYQQPAAHPHAQALRYAGAMDERGNGEIYRDALRPARQHADRAWSQMRQHGPDAMRQLREAFDGINAFADHLYARVTAEMSRGRGLRVKVYANSWNRRWRSQRSFFGGEDRTARGRRGGQAVQRKALSGDAPAGDPLAIAAAGLEGGGSTLPHLDDIQRAFGRHDVSGVRAYSGGAADAAARRLDARAYAMGESVVLDSAATDLHTVAHEAAHVVQQRGGVQLSGGVGRAGDSYEQHADRVADLVVGGQHAEALLDEFAPAGQTGRAVQRVVQMWNDSIPRAAADRDQLLAVIRAGNVTRAKIEEIAAALRRAQNSRPKEDGSLPVYLRDGIRYVHPDDIEPLLDETRTRLASLDAADQAEQQGAEGERTQDGQTPGPATNVSRDPVVNEIARVHPSGITTVLYADYPATGNARTDRNNREFPVQARGAAQRYQAVSGAGSQLAMGEAMTIRSHTDISQRVNETHATLRERYRATRVEGAADEPRFLKVKDLPIFCHGARRALLLPGTRLTTRNVEQIVGEMRDALHPNVNVQLFACNAADGEDSLSAAMAGALGEEASVFGHTTAAHATENSNARVFGAAAGNAAEGRHMRDVVFPPSFVDSELTRIWGAVPQSERDRLRAALVERLDRFYRMAAGLRGGWRNEVRQGMQPEVPGEGRVYSRLSMFGREMFMNPERASGIAQRHFTRWVAENVGEFEQLHPVTEAARGGDGTVVAGPDRSRAGRPASERAPSSGAEPGEGASEPAATTPPADRPAPSGAETGARAGAGVGDAEPAEEAAPGGDEAAAEAPAVDAASEWGRRGRPRAGQTLQGYPLQISGRRATVSVDGRTYIVRQYRAGRGPWGIQYGGRRTNPLLHQVIQRMSSEYRERGDTYRAQAVLGMHVLGEGGISAINTYDSKTFTLGAGFAGGRLNQFLGRLRGTPGGEFVSSLPYFPGLRFNRSQDSRLDIRCISRLVTAIEDSHAEDFTRAQILEFVEGSALPRNARRGEGIGNEIADQVQSAVVGVAAYLRHGRSRYSPNPPADVQRAMQLAPDDPSAQVAALLKLHAQRIANDRERSPTLYQRNAEPAATRRLPNKIPHFVRAMRRQEPGFQFDHGAAQAIIPCLRSGAWEAQAAPPSGVYLHAGEQYWDFGAPI